MFNVLAAYSEYNKKVAYCQGMNFIAGFILLVSGGNEEESFWFLVALLKTWRTNEENAVFDGLRGLYKAGFPLLHKY